MMNKCKKLSQKNKLERWLTILLENLKMFKLLIKKIKSLLMTKNKKIRLLLQLKLLPQLTKVFLRSLRFINSVKNKTILAMRKSKQNQKHRQFLPNQKLKIKMKQKKT